LGRSSPWSWDKRTALADGAAAACALGLGSRANRERERGGREEEEEAERGVKIRVTWQPARDGSSDFDAVKKNVEEIAPVLLLRSKVQTCEKKKRKHVSKIQLDLSTELNTEHILLE
jgi:hypothetical protein